MELFLNRDPSDTTFPWKEWHLQAYVVMQSRQRGLVVHGDTNGASKTPKGWGQASATGMLKGWPDLCYILLDGPLWIELKVGNGKRSKEQIELHEWMEKCGCRVVTIAADTPAQCWDMVLEVLPEFR